MTEHIKELRSGSLSWLLSLNGEDFIGAAYEMILRRPADPTGLEHYSKLLTERNDKIQIISDLFGSGEVNKWTQRQDICDAVFKHRHPVRWWLVKLFRPHKYVSHAGNEALHNRGVGASVALEEPKGDLAGAVLRAVSHIQDQLLQLEYRLDRESGEQDAHELLGEGETRYFFNLSTSNHWRRHAVGIVRVERELAAYLRRFRNVGFVLWDRSSKSLRKLEMRQVDRILSSRWCDSHNGLASYKPDHLSEPKLRHSDIYISVGLDWDHAPTDQVLKYLGQFSVKAILGCHDTVPIQFPEFLVREEMNQEFCKHLIEMAHGSHKVFANSNTTARDLVKFWKSAKLERSLPEVVAVTLASFRGASSLPNLDDRDQAILRSVFSRGEYILYVSSIEPRKNHKLILDIWRDLWAERGSQSPQFVHVGMVGWGSNDMLGRIPRMAAYKGGKINGLYDVGDDLLAHLYHHCAFTVFPSMYEGWGLAATEAMGFGKVCVVANNSSLVEATQNLMPSYHPLDYFGWKAEIEKLLDNTAYRQALEDKISKDYVHSTWDDFGESFCEKLLLG